MASSHTDQQAERNYALIHWNLRLQPAHRHELENALESVMAEVAPDFEVVGGGVEMDDVDGPLSCATEVEWSGDLDTVVDELADMAEATAATRGSWIQLENGDRIDIGVKEGVAVALNGTDLPDEVFESYDINDLVDELADSLGEAGLISSWWEGPEVTTLFVYGKSAQELRERMGPVLAAHPLAQLSRTFDIA